MGLRSWWRRVREPRLRKSEVFEVLKEYPLTPAAFDLSRTQGLQTEGGLGPYDQNFDLYLETIGHFPWISACIDAISSTCAAVPLNVMVDGAPDPEHELAELFGNPNPRQGFQEFWTDILHQCLYTGEAYLTAVGRPEEVPFVQPEELWVIKDSAKMAPKHNRRRMREGETAPSLIGYEFASETYRKTFTPEQIIHIRRPHPRDSVRALSPIKELQTTLVVMDRMRRYNENYFENHTSAGLVIQSSNRPAKGIREAFERKFGEDHAGSDAAGKNLWIWGHDLKIDKLTATPQEASYLESLARLREEILAVFKCPPFVVGLLEHANWSNAREQQQYYYRNAIIPWNRLLLNALNSSLLLAPYTERGQDVRLEHDYSDIEALQPNRKEQMESDVAYVASGIRTINEVREARSFGDEVPWGNQPKSEQEGLVLADSLKINGPQFRELVDRAKRLGLRESEKARALRAKAFNLRSAPIERAWVKTARRLLSGIRAAVLEEIGRRAAIAEGRALGQEVAKQNVPIPGGWVIDPLFDVAAVEDEWFVSFKELADRTVQTGGQDLFDEVADVFVGFNIERPEIQQFINERLASKIVTIVENRHSEVREIVRKSIELNQTIQELRDELRSHFDRKSAGWATRIARTETATLYNFGAEEAMKEANVPAKMWISARDDDVRESHRMVDGTVVPITGDFVLAGGSGPRPGEIGVPEEDINCRCTIVPEALPEA